MAAGGYVTWQDALDGTWWQMYDDGDGPRFRNPTLDERMDDLDAVMGATGVSRAALFGASEGASMSALFSATYPERVSHLVLYGGFARFTNCDDYDHMFTLEQMLRSVPYWGSGASTISPGRSSPSTAPRSSGSCRAVWIFANNSLHNSAYPV